MRPFGCMIKWTTRKTNTSRLNTNGSKVVHNIYNTGGGDMKAK